jgi:hypothetical protein
MRNDKALSPDGLSVAFYKSFKDLMLPLILAAFKEAFTMEVFPTDLAAG